jgi:aspartate ammonia-lyase
MNADARVEHDLLGARTIPAGVYWGIHTARAVENFPISGVTLAQHRPLIEALGAVKQAVARANRKSACWTWNALTLSTGPART